MIEQNEIEVKIKVPVDKIKTWVKALRSGKYSQAKKRLQTKDGYCCLGVACVEFIEDIVMNQETNCLLGAVPSSQVNSPEWLNHISTIVRQKLGESLIDLNDRDDYTFDEIADILELLFIYKSLD